MGNASYSHSAYTAHSKNAYAGKASSRIFTQSEIHPDLDPRKFSARECVASEANPHPTPIILACDETGSMGWLAREIIEHGLGKIFNALYNGRPVSDPQILVAGIGDSWSDDAPLQVSQFEAEGVTLAKQVEKIYIEGNGGSNRGESYPLIWLLANTKVKADCWGEGRKGYIFTIGDECPHLTIKKGEIGEVLGLTGEGDISVPALLKETLKKWEVFHLIVKPVEYQPVQATWEKLMGSRAVLVEDHGRLAEGIVAIIERVEKGKGGAIITSPATTALAVVSTSGAIKQSA